MYVSMSPERVGMNLCFKFFRRLDFYLFCIENKLNLHLQDLHLQEFWE
jgi:hypothetical protein